MDIQDVCLAIDAVNAVIWSTCDIIGWYASVRSRAVSLLLMCQHTSADTGALEDLPQNKCSLPFLEAQFPAASRIPSASVDL